MTVQTITVAQAEGFYNAILEKIRDRRDRFGESWEEATALALRQVGDGEAAGIFRHLVRQGVLSLVDVVITNAVSQRLGFAVKFERVELA